MTTRHFIYLQKLKRRRTSLEAVPWKEDLKAPIREILTTDYCSSEETDTDEASDEEDPLTNELRPRRVRSLQGESQKLKTYKTALDTFHRGLMTKKGQVVRARVRRPGNLQSVRRVPTQVKWTHTSSVEWQLCCCVHYGEELTLRQSGIYSAT